MKNEKQSTWQIDNEYLKELNSKQRDRQSKMLENFKFQWQTKDKIKE